MNRDKLRMLTIFGLAFYLLSLMAPAMVAGVDIEVPEALEEMIIPEQKDGYEQLNEVQKKALVDWSRNSTSHHSFFNGAGGAGDDIGTAIAIDADGNAFVTGDFHGNASFGNSLLTSSGDSDIFVAALSGTGSWLWVLKAGGITEDHSSGISTDLDGNAYVTGHFYEAATFGNTNLNSSGHEDIFVAKVSNAGTWVWAIKAGGTSHDRGNGISVDLNGDVHLTGNISETATFGNIHLNSSGWIDIFVAKVDSTGSWLWALQAGGTLWDRGNGIAVDSSGNSYVTGYFYGTATFGDIILMTSGSFEIFVAKVSSSGSWLWALKAGGTSSDAGHGIAIDSNDDIYVTGYFASTATFGGTSIVTNGGYDIFVAKLNSSGSWMWALGAGGPFEDNGSAIAVEPSGDVYVTGYFGGGIVKFGSNSLLSSGDTDIFVAKVSNDGYWSWSMNGGGINADRGSGIATDSAGNVYVTGSFSGITTFGSTSLFGEMIDFFILSLPTELTLKSQFSSVMTGTGTSHVAGQAIVVDSSGNAFVTGKFHGTATFGTISLVSMGSYDIFVAMLSESGTWSWAVKGGGTDNDAGIGIVIDSFGYIWVTGTFAGAATFGSTILVSSGQQDIFVAILTSTGSWSSGGGGSAISAGGTQFDVVSDIAIDWRDDIYLTGQFQGTSYFGSTSLTSSSGYDIFVAKVGRGEWPWAVKAGGSGSENGYGIAVDSSLNVYVTGDFYSTTTFGSISLTSSSYGDIYVAKVSSSGAWSWAVKAGGARMNKGMDIAVDASGNAYVTGVFQGTVVFGNINLTGQSFAYNIFLAKLDSDGIWDWAVAIEGTSSAFGTDVVIDLSGNLYLTGYFYGMLSFGNNTLVSSGSVDVFVAKADNAGTWLWQVNAGGSGNDHGYGLAMDTSGGAYLTGSFSDIATFGTTTLVSTGGTDIFVALLSIDMDDDKHSDVDDEFIFESSQYSDEDEDGFGDNLTGYHGDSCPLIFGTSWQDRWGCADLDNDGQSDLNDAYMQNPTQWNDSDGDGLGDNWDGTVVNRNGSNDGIGEYWPNAYLPDPSPLDYDNDGFDDSTLQFVGAAEPYDDCPLIYGTSTEDVSGCVDSDGDGWSDSSDSHPGDGTQHNDLDGDGYGDDENGNLADDCPSEWGNSTQDSIGCPDGDGDGWSETADFDDTDPTRWGVDSDGDGVGDQLDDFPVESSQWSDSDGDGYGDNPDGTEPDGCPTQMGSSDLGLLGCPDTDRDGWGDVEDTFPADATQHVDSDGDGFGDSAVGRNPDSCPAVVGNSTEANILGCPDTDFDGWADSIDIFPNSSVKWSDADADGFADQGADDCPNLHGLSNISMVGCPDLDGDGLPDILDPDIDGDGLFNTWEYQTETNPFDAMDYPADTDGDGTPDQFDDDDDGDTFPDSLEEERGTDPLNANETPLSQYGDNSGIYWVPGEGFSSSYDADAYEFSVSALVDMLSSEYLIPLLLLPASLLLILRKRGRFKKMRRRLENVGESSGLDGVEELIDHMIMKNKVKLVHGVVLRNLFERRRDALSDDRGFNLSQAREQRAEQPPRRPDEWGAPPQRPDDFGNDPNMGGGGRY